MAAGKADPAVAGGQSCAWRVSLRHRAITSAQCAGPSPGQHWPSLTPGHAPTTDAAPVPGDTIGEDLSITLMLEAHSFNVFLVSDPQHKPLV